MTVDLNKTPFLQSVWLTPGWWWMAKAKRDAETKQITIWREVGVEVQNHQAHRCVGEEDFYGNLDQSWEIYQCLYPTTEPVRRKVYVEYGMYVAADIDDGMTRWQLDTFIPTPTMAMETSPGRFQAVWQLVRPVGIQRLTCLARGLAQVTNADAGSSSIPKMIRMPNSWNHKYSEPVKVEQLWQDGPLWDADDLPCVTETEVDEEPPPDEGMVDVEGFVETMADTLGPVEGPRLRECWYATRVLDRSKLGWRMINLLLEAGATERQTFAICWQWRWNKFKERPEGKEQLWREVLKAAARK